MEGFIIKYSIQIGFVLAAFMGGGVSLSYATKPMSPTACFEGLESYIGQNYEDIKDEITAEIGDRPYRVLGPNSMATMDYSPDRLNIHLDDRGVIIDLKCG